MSRNWDAFKFELRHEGSKLRDDLVNLEAYRLSVNRLILPQEWKQDLQRLYIVRAVHGTTAIEGNPLTEAEVSRQLTQGERGRQHRDQVHQQTENAAAAFRWVEQHFARPRPISLEDILTLHRLLTTDSDEAENVPGRLRAPGHNVQVGSPDLGGVHRAPPGGDVTERLVRGFLEFINSNRFRSQHPVIQALAAHFYFVTLHPFGDGNGRTTRCIEAAILYSGGYNTHGFYSLSNYFYRNRDEYIKTLQYTRTRWHYDLTQFLLFGLRGFTEELERINAYVRNRMNRLHYRELIRRCSERRVGKRRRLLNEREAELLHGILDASRPADPFSNEPSKQADRNDLARLIRTLYRGKSQKTIVRELDRLTKLGFIEVSFEKGAPEYRVSVNFSAIEHY